MKYFFKLSSIYLLFLCAFLGGCGSLIGNIKPIEEKSHDYGVLDLARDNDEWVTLENSEPLREGEGLLKSEISDRAYQSKRTASIISINSACKTIGNYEKNANLSQLSQQLLLGMSDISLRTEEKKSLNSFPSLETTVIGKLNDEKMMIRTVVLTRGKCVYDLMYIARPEKFQENEKDFSRFVSSLSLR